MLAVGSSQEKHLYDHRHGKILYLELGVGFNPPGVIKIPFWQMAEQNSDVIFASVNLVNPCYPESLRARSIVISHDIDEVIRELKKADGE